jgi:hypothetical protein
MSPIFMTEWVSPRILSRHADLVASADVCWAARASQGRLALPILDDPRGQIGTSQSIFAAEARLAHWAHSLAMSQPLDAQAFSPIERTLLGF